MNKSRREQLRKAIELLSKASGVVDHVADQEQDSLDNIPENLLASERCERMEEIVDLLADASESIDEAKGKIEDTLT